jgi:hypothetical protein
MYNKKTNNKSVLTDVHLTYIKTAVPTENGNLLPVQKMPGFQPFCIGGSGKMQRIRAIAIFVE